MHALYLNTNGDSVTNLAVQLDVEGYACGVITMRGSTNAFEDKSLFLCCDIIEESNINDKRLPVLREIVFNKKGTISNKIEHIIWLQVLRPTISSIRLYICNENGEIVSFGNKKVYCTLLFIPPKKNHGKC